MSIIDIEEEVVSDVDINLQFDANGLRLSIYIDSCEIHEHVDFDDMAYMMVQDVDKYPPQLLRCIRKGLACMLDIIEEAEEEEENEE